MAALLSTLAGCATSMPPPVSAPAPSAPASVVTTADGVFTAAQAADGERAFRASCQGCHETREFSGIRFTIRWSGQTVGELFDVLSTTMPQGSPGSLDAETYAALVAFLLRLNEYPVDESPLSGGPSRLSAIAIVDSG